MGRHVFLITLVILHSACLVFNSSGSHAYASEEEYSTEFRENLLPAQQGDAKAQIFVGYLYETGQGVQQDYTKAAEWYRRAAEKGSPIAQEQLGNMYRYGRGVSQNYVLAYMWLDLAARQGNNQAKITRESVAKKMSLEQISEAKRLSRQWKTGK
jgi:TPR repeat protein